MTDTTDTQYTQMQYLAALEDIIDRIPVVALYQGRDLAAALQRNRDAIQAAATDEEALRLFNQLFPSGDSYHSFVGFDTASKELGYSRVVTQDVVEEHIRNYI